MNTNKKGENRVWLSPHDQFTYCLSGIFGSSDIFLAGPVEDVHLFGVERHLNFIARTQVCPWVNPGNETLFVFSHQVNKDFITHQLGHVHDGINQLLDHAGRFVSRMVNIFGTDSKDYFATDVIRT